MKKKIKIIQSIAGNPDARYELPLFAFAPGDTPLIHKELADAWIASGIAAPVDPDKKDK